MILGRFLLRLLLVPLAASFAVAVASLVVIIAHWNRMSALLVQHSATSDDFIVAFVIAATALVWIQSLAAIAMLLPASIGILISEAFAIRSWMFHVANGALSAWIGWYVTAGLREPSDFYERPLIVVGAGIAAGFAYWAVAGWSAGFWKPVFSSPPPAPSSAASA